MILKVKEPIAIEYERMQPGQILFTYLHLAASPECTQALLDRRVTAIAYETVQLPGGALPLLAPMSEVAGRLAPQVGAYHLMAQGGGRGTLMGGVSGRLRGQGRGHRGRGLRDERRGDRARHAGRGAAAGPQHRQAPRGRPDLPGPPADHRLQRVRGGAGGAGRRPGDRRGAGARGQGADAWSATSWSAGCGRAACWSTSPSTRAAASRTAGRPPTPSRRSGCTTRSSTAWPTCPARCRNTSTYALTNVTLPYAVSLANQGWQQALRADPALALGLNTHDGEVTNAPVAQAHGLPHRPLAEVLG